MRVTIDISFRDFAEFTGMKHVTVYRLFQSGKTKALESAFETKVKQTCNKGETPLKFKSVEINDKDTENETRVKQTCNKGETDKESERKEESSPHTPFIEEKKGKEREAPCSGVQSENIKFSSVHPCPPGDEGERGDFLSHENSGKGKIPVVLGSKKGLFPIVVSGVMPKKPLKDFVPPTVAEVEARIAEKRYDVDAEEFVAFYASKGWMVGKNRMKDWRMALVTWQKGAERRKTEHYGNDRTDSWGKRRAAPVIASSAEEYEGAF